MAYDVINVICDVMTLPGHEVTHSVTFMLEDGRAMMKSEQET